MASSNDNFDLLYSPQTTNGDGLRKFSDELQKYKGKILEFYIGDVSETINLEETSVPQNCVIYGELIEVLDRFLIIKCFHYDSAAKKLLHNNILYLNSFQIRAMSPLDGNGSLQDVFLGVSDAKRVRKLLSQGKQ
jgi:hypothetical protein